MMRVKTETMTR